MTYTTSKVPVDLTQLLKPTLLESLIYKAKNNNNNLKDNIYLIALLIN